MPDSAEPRPTKVIFSGRHPRTVDSARRFILPNAWRGDGFPKNFYIVLWPTEQGECLMVLTTQRFEEMAESLEQASLNDSKARKISAFISSHAYPRSLDAYGRLQLPEEESARVGITRECLLQGVLGRFEIWPADKAQEVDSQLTADAFQAIKDYQYKL